MSAAISQRSIEDQAKASLESWSKNAEFWDSHMGVEGDFLTRLLKVPALEELLPLRPGLELLELAAGNGIYSRHAAAQGVSVLSTDGSVRMVEIASSRTAAEPSIAGKLEHRVLDLVDANQMEELAHRHDGKFDVVVMNMALMDVPDIGPLAKTLPRILKPGGIFVATLLHPVFATSDATREIRMTNDPENRESRVKRTMIISKYLNMRPGLGEAVPGQPVKQPYFHRPFHALFAPFFATGMVLDGLLEPSFADVVPKNEERPESWANFEGFPFVLAFRMRNAGQLLAAQ